MPAWRRTLYILTAAEFIAVAGFTVIMPFLPYFVQELGITDPDQVKLWTGRLFAAQAVSMAAIAPIWGTLADRYSRKLMVERAMFGGALVFIGMGLVQNVYQLLALRILQGFLTGTVPAATALVASTTPRERSGSSWGSCRPASFWGPRSVRWQEGSFRITWAIRPPFGPPAAACCWLDWRSITWCARNLAGRSTRLAGRMDACGTGC